jgi:hypothetical protein
MVIRRKGVSTARHKAAVLCRDMIVHAFTNHPNRAAVERLLTAITDATALDDRLRQIDSSDPSAITAAEWRDIEIVERAAVAVRDRIVEAAKALGVEFDDGG